MKTSVIALWLLLPLAGGTILVGESTPGSLAIRAANVEQALDLSVANWRQKYSRPAATPFPSDNGYTKQREELGKVLFFDPRLSGSGSIACASCHNPGFSWGDGMARAVGMGSKQLGRRSPTILNTAWADALMWDGRAGSLEEQALLPITAEKEMGGSLAAVLQTVTTIPEYKALLEQAYPGEPVSQITVARAIATFERTVVSGEAPFDRWIAGDNGAISNEAKLGFQLFNGKASCAKCHSSWNFTDNGFHDIGLNSSDLGRGAKLPLVSMQYAFKTPTLRNIDRRAPYMHDGSEKTLAEVVELYDKGGAVRRPSLSPEIVPLNLSAEEKHQLVVFLQTLTSSDSPTAVPVLPR